MLSRIPTIFWTLHSQPLAQPAAKHCARGLGWGVSEGENSGMAKLTVEKVITVLRLIGKGVSDCEISRHFGVNSSTIRSIRHGKTWRHVQGKYCAGGIDKNGVVVSV